MTAAIKGEYTDLKYFKMRERWAITIEFETLEEITGCLGSPRNHANNRFVAVAPLIVGDVTEEEFID